MSNSVPLLGAHMSIGGGLYKALARGEALGCTAVQIFTRNATRWKSKPLSDKEIAKFKAERDRTGIRTIVHDSYLINLGSPKRDLREKSVKAFLDEMERAEQLGIPSLVMHPGAHTGAGEEQGLKSIASSLNELMADTSGYRLKILLENTAGQGTVLGYSFEQLAAIMEGLNHPERVGVCLDTCHAFAAGYDLRDKASYDQVIDDFDRIIGLEWIEALHLNDSLKGLGSRVDRHEHIGAGQLGSECFRLIMNDERFFKIPKVIETPKGVGLRDMDKINLEALRAMIR